VYFTPGVNFIKPFLAKFTPLAAYNPSQNLWQYADSSVNYDKKFYEIGHRQLSVK